MAETPEGVQFNFPTGNEKIDTVKNEEGEEVLKASMVDYARVGFDALLVFLLMIAVGHGIHGS
jgi:hypothetical protein